MAQNSLIDKLNKPFLFIGIITASSVILIYANVIFGLNLPFSVPFLAAYVGISLVFVFWHAWLTKGWQLALLTLALSFLIAFTAEVLGVNFGLIFGHYYYTEVLGPSLFGVPFLAAFAWEPILYAAFHISNIVIIQSQNKEDVVSAPSIATLLWAAFAGAIATTAWDLMIDPIAVKYGWWVWVDGGAYAPNIANGVPIQNYFGWLMVSFVILFIYHWLTNQNVTQYTQLYNKDYGPFTLYLSLFLTASGVALTVLGHPEIAMIGTMGMAPFLLITYINLRNYSGKR